MTQKYGHLKLDLNEQLESNFKLGEFLWLPQWEIYAFPTETQYIKICLLANKMQMIRDLFDCPINIHCALRPQHYNNLVGGAKNSQHLYGAACDFDVEDMDCDSARIQLLDKLDEFEIRMEDLPGASWIHIDLNYSKDGNSFFKP